MKPDLAYLVGALRDGSAYYDKNSRNYKIIWYENSQEWLKNSIMKRAYNVFKKNPRLEEYKRNYFRVVISSQKVFNIIKKDFEFISPQEKWQTPKSIKNSSQHIIATYVAGFFDAEGDINTKKYMIGFSQKNKEALEFIRDWLNRNSIKTSKIFIADKKSKTKRFYITSKENFKKFSDLVKFEHPDKVNRFGILLQQT